MFKLKISFWQATFSLTLSALLHVASLSGLHGWQTISDKLFTLKTA